MNTVKKLKSESTELPDCVISYIFSKLSLKNLVKTSALSKHWYHEWGLRKDLTFDLLNMFDYNTVPELPITLPLFQKLQCQFATRLDYFMQKYPGDMIRLIRVNFPLGVDHTYAIDRLIHKGLVKGANRIELLFANETDFKIRQYNFLFPFMFGPNSLTYLHLQNCRITPTMDFSGLKNLKTLVLHLVPVEQNMLWHLCFNCIHLENFTLNECNFISDIRITSSTLLHLKINCGRIITERNIDIIASKLLSIEYSSDCLYNRALRIVNIKAHMLSKFSYRCVNIFNLVDFSGLKNVTTIVFDGIRESLQSEVITHLFSNCLQLEDVTFKECQIKCDMKIVGAKLRHLRIIDCPCTNLCSYRIDIDALNLTSFEYMGCTFMTPIISVRAPKLLKVFWDTSYRIENVYNFDTIATKLHLLEDLTMNMHRSQISELSKDLVRFQNLRQLKLFIVGAYNPDMDYFWILDIAMASPHLKKLSLTIKNGHREISHMVGSQRQKREYVRFFHNGLKYVELHGCVCSINVIELTSHLLRSAPLLKQISFSSRHNYYIGAGRWTMDSDGCCWFEQNFIHEHLKEEVNEQCQLIIL
ncbi:F-box/LRR-repeat protein 13-like [Vicia villosa]|uniref:F-box/LRR-repeat protein 13-like n=1 Tax=Vicia villosa TaxID=3911 RepID=UPI00273C281F|nr:F-box/LRR-repeat protein 13-like [Vicia villosa]